MSGPWQPAIIIACQYERFSPTYPACVRGCCIAVSKHIKNIYEEGELESLSTVSKKEIVRKEGSREVRRQVDFYNLDVIISVGYRIRSLFNY